MKSLYFTVLGESHILLNSASISFAYSPFSVETILVFHSRLRVSALCVMLELPVMILYISPLLKIYPFVWNPSFEYGAEADGASCTLPGAAPDVLYIRNSILLIPASFLSARGSLKLR